MTGGGGKQKEKPLLQIGCAKNPELLLLMILAPSFPPFSLLINQVYIVWEEKEGEWTAAGWLMQYYYYCCCGWVSILEDQVGGRTCGSSKEKRKK